MVDIGGLINELVSHIESALAVDSDYVDCVRTDTLQTVVGLLKEQEHKKGSWDYGTQCSVCKGTIIPPKDRKVRVNFCPWCGADMREKVINSPGIIKAMQEKAQKDGEQE